MLAYMKKYFGDWPIRSKIMLLTISVNTVTLFAVVLAMYLIYQADSLERINRSIGKNMEIAEGQVIEKINKILIDSFELTANHLFQVCTKQENLSKQQYLNNYLTLQNSLYKMTQSSELIDTVFVAHKQKNIYNLERLGMKQPEEVFYGWELERIDGITFLPACINPYGDHGRVIPLAIPVDEIEGLNVPIIGTDMGKAEMTIFVLLSQERLQGLLQSLNTVADSYLYLADDQAQGLSLVLPESLARSLNQDMAADWGAVKEKIGEERKDYYLSFRSLPDFPLKLVHLLPKSVFGEVTKKVRPIFLLIWLLTSLLAAGMTVLLSDVITKPLLYIIQKVSANQRIEKKAKYKDEIGILITALTGMYETIDRQIQTIEKQAEQVRTAEMEMLTQQINPHFLYNVLDNTRWKILAEDKAAADIIEKLSAFLRLSLNQGNRELPFEQEIRHIQLYLNIMAYVERQDIRLLVDCENALKEYSIIHLILQPMVENSIKHGFSEPFPETVGKEIRIGFYQDGENLVLEVTDNGKGMNIAKMKACCGEQVLAEDAPKSSIGLRNVYLRLCRRYNTAIKAEFFSIPYVKNSICFYLPKE